VDRYSRGGRTTWRWDRTMRGELRDAVSLLPIDGQADVLHGLTFEQLRFLDQGDLGWSASAIVDLNRDFARDAVEARASVWFRAYPGAQVRRRGTP
jgi:hypothetical protein